VLQSEYGKARCALIFEVLDMTFAEEYTEEMCGGAFAVHCHHFGSVEADLDDTSEWIEYIEDLGVLGYERDAIENWCVYIWDEIHSYSEFDLMLDWHDAFAACSTFSELQDLLNRLVATASEDQKETVAYMQSTMALEDLPTAIALVAKHS